MMSSIKKSHVLVLCFLVIFLFVTPLVSTNLRPKFLYLVINLLIIALCAEAGLLSTLPKPHLEEIKRLASLVPAKIPEITSLVPKLPEIIFIIPNIPEITTLLPKIPEITTLLPKIPNIASIVPKIPEITTLLPKIPDIASLAPKLPEIVSIIPKIPEMVALVPRVLPKRSPSLKINIVKVDEKVRKLLAAPSLFFVGNAEPEEEHEEEEEEEVEEEQFSEYELFAKSEDFIGNFYKELKMQRQDSWKERVVIKPFHDYLACN